MAKRKILDYDGLSSYDSTLKEYISQNKEDKSNKITSLSSSSTNEQYPSAKSVVDYVKQTTGSIYNFMGSIYLGNSMGNIPSASTMGKGSVYNIAHGSGTLTLTEQSLGSITLDSASSFTISCPLPPHEFVSLEIINESTRDSRVITDIQEISYNPDTGLYSYYDNSYAFVDVDITDSWSVVSLTYTLSYSTGDNIISTGSYWDNFGSYIDLSDYATKNDVSESFENMLAGQVNVGYVNVSNNGRITTPAIYINDGVPNWRGLVQYDGNGAEITMEDTLANYATKADLVQLENNLKAYINEIILGGEW